MAIGDVYKSMMLSRTGLKDYELVCPREKSDMTPCVARDGDCAMTEDFHCVGCGSNIQQLIRDEEARLKTAESQATDA